jgi:hypothetical protein
LQQAHGETDPHATIIPKNREELRRNKKTSGAPHVPTVRRSAVQIKQMPISVTVDGPKIEGLELMSPAAPEFDAAARSLFTGNSNELLKLKPFLTILSNRCERTLVAYALKWEVALHAERRITTSQHKYPDAVVPGAPRRGNEIRPGEQKIVAMSIELDCGRWGGEATQEFYLSQFINWFTQYNDANALEISIDAAIFDDGEFIGPNKSDLVLDFKSYVDAKQDYYRMILQGLDSGMSFDEAFAPVEAVVKANAVNPGLDSRDVRTMWKRIAAPEVRMWRLKYGDDGAAEIYRRAVRTEPFMIRGGASPDAAENERILSHVACPRCHLSPKSTDRWYCSCGNRWNTFETRGLCPACNYQWKETACPVCGELSPHADWYIGQ